jgi:hypothetical protein
MILLLNVGNKDDCRKINTVWSQASRINRGPVSKGSRSIPTISLLKPDLGGCLADK